MLAGAILLYEIDPPSPETDMTPAKKSSSIPPAQLALYEKLIATMPEIVRKGAVHPYTSLNGHMFSYLD